MAKERQTRQKQVILAYLGSVRTHPTAEQVYRAVKKKLPKISLATVYRNLELLKNKGQILELGTDIKHFDGFTHQHDHFVCESCGKIYDVSSQSKYRNKQYINGVGKVRSCKVYYFGLCQKCEK